MTSLRPLIAAAPLLAAALAIGCSAAPATSTPAASGPGPSVGASGAGAVVVNVVMTNAGCVPDRSSVPAGSISIKGVNEGADKVSELELMQGDRVLAERENLTPGLSGTFTLVLEPGSYILYCPGATTEKTPFEVTSGSSMVDHPGSPLFA